jgi:hypothetical protein
LTLKIGGREKLISYKCSDMEYISPFCCILYHTAHIFNPLTPNDLQRRRRVSPLKIKIPSKNMREKPTNTPIIHSVY